MKRFFLLIVFLVLITGCKAEYNLTINGDLSINEEATLTGTEAFFANYYKTTKKNVLKSALDVYHDILDENGYQYTLIDDTIPYVKVSKKFLSINDYIKETLLLNDYFDEIKYVENGNIRKIETVGFNPNNPDNPERFDVQELTIAITCPYKVLNHNAKKINEKTNTYYYEFQSDKETQILLEFDVKKEYNPHEKATIAIVIGVLLVIGSWIIVYMLNKKKNK